MRPGAYERLLPDFGSHDKASSCCWTFVPVSRVVLEFRPRRIGILVGEGKIGQKNLVKGVRASKNL